MKRKIFGIFSAILKNILTFLAGGVIGVAVVLIFARQLLGSAITKDVGLGVIALAPAVLVIYAILFGIGGGIIGLIVYNGIRVFRRR